MHSPIIYIIEQDSEYAKSLRGNLPQENEMYDEDLFFYIDESDWLNANTLDDDHWHRNQWNEDFKNMFDSSNYTNLEESENGDLKLTFDQRNLKNWYVRLLELNEESNRNIQEHLKDNYNKTPYFFPYSSMDSYMEAKDMSETAFGGIRYVMYVTSPTDDTLEMYDVFKQKNLMDYVQSKLESGNKKVEFAICQNIVGDYHY
jgi:LEA14-like dessication related protein